MIYVVILVIPAAPRLSICFLIGWEVYADVKILLENHLVIVNGYNLGR